MRRARDGRVSSLESGTRERAGALERWNAGRIVDGWLLPRAALFGAGQSDGLERCERVQDAETGGGGGVVGAVGGPLRYFPRLGLLCAGDG